MFYKHYEQKPLSEANFQHTAFSEVQSGLAQSVRQIISNPVAFGQGHDIIDLDVDMILPQYDKRSFIENDKRYKELKKWYEENKSTIDKLQNGDYSDFQPPVEKTEE